MAGPVLAQQKEFSQTLTGAFRYEFRVTERFEITTVIQEGRQVNKNLLKLNLTEPRIFNNLLHFLSIRFLECS